MKYITTLLSIALVCISASFAQTVFDFKANYSKEEYMIEMRDGIKLHTVVHSPRDNSQEYPIMLIRSPYSIGPSGPDNYANILRAVPHIDMAGDGYIFVMQNVRGTYKSEGVFVDIRPPRTNPDDADESTDNFDTIEWLINNLEGHNGRVGQWGVSHPGWFTVMGMIEPHPALKAASPQATTGDPFIGDDGHRNGIFRLMPKLAWAQGLIESTGENRNSPDREQFKPPFGTNWGYEFYLKSGPINRINEKYFGGRLSSEWEDLMNHPNYDDYYKARHMPQYMKDITVPVLNVGGWFDAPDPYGTIATYQGIEKLTPDNTSTLIMGPWDHGGWRGSGEGLGDIKFDQATGEYYNKNYLIPFFAYYLKDKGNWQPSEAIMFSTGSNNWQNFNQWPPDQIEYKALYLNAGFKLSFEKPHDTAADSYINDPEHPVPYSQNITFGYPRGSYRISDQRHQVTRPDVLTYTSDILPEDLTIAGPMLPILFTDTTGTDSDWFVKVIDVFPSDHLENPGYHMLVGAEGMRAKYRNSFEHPEPITPNELTEINFEIRDKFHTFKKGHRIMVQIHSTWFPIYDRNPGQFMNIYGADMDDYQKTTQTIHRSNAAPSHVLLPVLE